MKSLLWWVLAVAAVVNAAGNLAFDGVLQVLFSAVTGVAVIGAAVGLYMTRGQRG